MAVIKNGTARPREKTSNKKVPTKTVCVLLAINSIEAKIGPTQGVHPPAKDDPRIKAPDFVPGFKFLNLIKEKFFSKNGSLKTLKIYSPKIIINIPPILVKKDLKITK